MSWFKTCLETEALGRFELDLEIHVFKKRRFDAEDNSE